MSFTIRSKIRQRKRTRMQVHAGFGAVSRGGTSLGGRFADLAGRSVFLTTASQLTTAVAPVELDGIARRIVIVPPDVEADHFEAVIAAAETDAVVDKRMQHRNKAIVALANKIARIAWVLLRRPQTLYERIAPA
jgi:hypothetical protein